jgi:transposase
VSLVQDQNRIEKVLEDAHLKLGNAVSDRRGLTGRKILHAVAAGGKDPGWMADYAQGTLRRKRQELEEALHGFVTGHHRMLLSILLRQTEASDRDIDALEREIRRRLDPHQEVVERLTQIPRVRRSHGLDGACGIRAGHECVWHSGASGQLVWAVPGRW